MKMEPSDRATGLLVILLLAGVMLIAGGAGGLLYAALLWSAGGLVLFLWKKESLAAKALAVMLLPAILLTFLLPGKLKRSIQSIGKTEPHLKRSIP